MQRSEPGRAWLAVRSAAFAQSQQRYATFRQQACETTVAVDKSADETEDLVLPPYLPDYRK